jgi:hypothetical protein
LAQKCSLFVNQWLVLIHTQIFNTDFGQLLAKFGFHVSVTEQSQDFIPAAPEGAAADGDEVQFPQPGPADDPVVVGTYQVEFAIQDGLPSFHHLPQVFFVKSKIGEEPEKQSPLYSSGQSHVVTR